MREAAELAEAACGLLELEAGEGIGVRAVGPDAEAVEEGAADQMRRLPCHRADADIDAGLAEIHRIELRMRVGDVQDARIAEPLDVVDARGSRRRAQAAAGRAMSGGSGCDLQEIAAADRIRDVSAPSMSQRLFQQRSV